MDLEQQERKGLPVWLKVVLVMLAIVVGLALLLTAGAVVLYKRYGAELASNVKAQVAEGAAFGATTDEEGCLDRVLGDYRAAPGLKGSIGATAFLSSCFKQCAETAKFCSDVPPTTDLVASAEWRVARCQEAGLTDHYCPHLFAQVQTHCEAPENDEEGDEESGPEPEGESTP